MLEELAILSLTFSIQHTLLGFPPLVKLISALLVCEWNLTNEKWVDSWISANTWECVTNISLFIFITAWDCPKLCINLNMVYLIQELSHLWQFIIKTCHKNWRKDMVAGSVPLCSKSTAVFLVYFWCVMLKNLEVYHFFSALSCKLIIPPA